MFRFHLPIQTATLCLIFIFAVSIRAVPNVTVVPLSDSCASYPKFDESTGGAGPWLAFADETDRIDFDGVRVTAVFATAVGGFSWGLIAIPPPYHTAGISMRCANDSLQANLDMGPTGDEIWQSLVIATTPGEKALGFRLPDLPDPTLPVEIYEHSVDGVTQPGVFLGSGNVTTWGFNYINDKQTGEFYYLRLVGPETDSISTGKPLNDGEFTGFVRITG